MILLFHIVSFYYFGENCLFLIRTGNQTVVHNEITGKNFNKFILGEILAIRSSIITRITAHTTSFTSLPRIFGSLNPLLHSVT